MQNLSFLLMASIKVSLNILSTHPRGKLKAKNTLQTEKLLTDALKKKLLVYLRKYVMIKILFQVTSAPNGEQGGKKIEKKAIK